MNLLTVPAIWGTPIILFKPRLRRPSWIPQIVGENARYQHFRSPVWPRASVEIGRYERRLVALVAGCALRRRLA